MAMYSIRKHSLSSPCFVAGFIVVSLVVAKGRMAAAEKLPGGVSLEATELTGDGDLAPTFVEGPSPRMPVGTVGLQPTIVCRLHIDTSGKVTSASLYRSRPDLSNYEKAALASARSAVFLPARRAHRPVAVWLNWPVHFGALTGQPDSQATGRVRIKGSDTIGGELGPALARAFESRHPKVQVSVESKGSATAFIGLIDGSADIGAASRTMNAAEMSSAKAAGFALHEFVLGYDGIVVIVHPTNPIHDLSIDQIARLFTGRARTWAGVGGNSSPVHVVGRPPSSGTRVFFRDRVLRGDDPKRADDFSPDAIELERNEEIVELVARDAQAVAYVGHGSLRPVVRAVAISLGPGKPACFPGVREIAGGRYPIHRPLLLYTRGQPSSEVAGFLRLALSPVGQTLVTKCGFVPSDIPLDVAADTNSDNQVGP
jgi:phosphate binding protein